MSTLAELFNKQSPGLGDHYQVGVRPGARKLHQFLEACQVAGVPTTGDSASRDPVARVKIFNPCGNQSWYLTEYYPETNTAFGLVVGEYPELGYICLEELSRVKGRMGVGLELDMHWEPRKLSEIRAALDV